MMMRKLARNIRALGTPVANLIVITAAVLLTTAVIFFATNVTSSQVQKENMYISNTHLWYVNSTYSVGAAVITNTGATDVVLSKIAIKGLVCAWNGSDNYIIYNKTDTLAGGDLPFVLTLNKTIANNVDIGGVIYTFNVAGDDFVLRSGWTMMFYIALPGRLMVYDLGLPARILITTSQSVYVTETLVQTA
jgi:hypothetical protein